MAQYAFGTGLLWGTANSDVNGNTLATPTPVTFGTLQEVSIDISFDKKELYGQSQFPQSVARGKGKIEGKAKFARMNGLLLNSLFFGQTLTTAAGVADYYDQTGSVVPTTPFTITIAPANSGVWSADLGVGDSNGRPLTKVASAPAAGQYSVAAGVYTFNTAQAGQTVFISYQYTTTTGVPTATSIIETNPLMGNAPFFRADVAFPFQGKQVVFTFPYCLATKLNFATKLDDYTVPEFDFSAFASPAGQVFTMALAE
jgi:hypothetical protein